MDWDEFIALLPEPATVQVEPFLGAGGYGDQYGPAVAIDRCFVDRHRKRVRVQTQDTAGAIVVSSTQVYCPPGSVAPPGSMVTIPDGTRSKVLSLAGRDDHGLGLPEHVELLLE